MTRKSSGRESFTQAPCSGYFHRGRNERHLPAPPRGLAYPHQPIRPCANGCHQKRWSPGIRRELGLERFRNVSLRDAFVVARLCCPGNRERTASATIAGKVRFMVWSRFCLVACSFPNIYQIVLNSHKAVRSHSIKLRNRGKD